MFEFKHEIELKSSEKIKIFGQDYFGDKSTFWNAHQTTLNDLYRKVSETGFPIKINDLQFDKIVVIENIDEFHSWLKFNQPFDFKKVNRKISYNKIKSLTCGIFISNSWNEPKAYRIYVDKIELDDSGNYWSKRFSKNGYQFKGEIIETNTDKLNEVSKIFSHIPSKCFELELPSPNTPGNKDEHEIYIQIELKDGRSTEFKIDEYDARDADVDFDILTFKDKVKDIIKLIEKADNNV